MSTFDTIATDDLDDVTGGGFWSTVGSIASNFLGGGINAPITVGNGNTINAGGDQRVTQTKARK